MFPGLWHKAKTPLSFWAENHPNRAKEVSCALGVWWRGTKREDSKSLGCWPRGPTPGSLPSSHRAGGAEQGPQQENRDLPSFGNDPSSSALPPEDTRLALGTRAPTGAEMDLQVCPLQAGPTPHPDFCGSLGPEPLSHSGNSGWVTVGSSRQLWCPFPGSGLRLGQMGCIRIRPMSLRDVPGILFFLSGWPSCLRKGRGATFLPQL